MINVCVIDNVLHTNVSCVSALTILAFTVFFIHLVQRRAIVTALDAHREDLDVTSLASDLKKMGILTAEQYKKLASLNDKERRHEALLYTLLAHDGPDTFGKLVGCMGLRDSPIATELQGELVSKI